MVGPSFSTILLLIISSYLAIKLFTLKFEILFGISVLSVKNSCKVIISITILTFDIQHNEEMLCSVMLC